MKKRLIQSFLMFASALLLFFGVVFAWFSLTPTVKVENFVVNINNYDAIIILEVKKNDGDYTAVTSQEDIYQIFYNTVPDDYLYFRLTVINNSNNPVTADIFMNNITSVAADDYDMRNVFYFVDGKISIDGNAVYIEVNDETPVTEHGQTLPLYRLNNIINDDSDLFLVNDLPYAGYQTRVLEFAIAFDYNTEAKGYEEGILAIASLNIFFNITGE